MSAPPGVVVSVADLDEKTVNFFFSKSNSVSSEIKKSRASGGHTRFVCNGSISSGVKLAVIVTFEMLAVDFPQSALPKPPHKGNSTGPVHSVSPTLGSGKCAETESEKNEYTLVQPLTLFGIRPPGNPMLSPAKSGNRVSLKLCATPWVYAPSST